MCEKECDVKCKNKTCDAFNGSCIYGCADPNALTLDCLGKDLKLMAKGQIKQS